MIKFTVLTSLYNSKMFIDRFFSTIAKQILQPEEIVLIDDTRNPENLIDIINEKKSLYKFKKITLIKNEKNLGPARSLNLGLLKCTNDLIFRLDVDDLWSPNHTLVMTDKFQKNPDYLIYSNTITTKNFFEKIKCDKFFINENHLIHSSWLINRKVFKNFKYHLEQPYAAIEDYFTLLYHINKNFKVSVSNEKTVSYVSEPDSHGKKFILNPSHMKLKKFISTFFLKLKLKEKNFFQKIYFLLFDFGITRLLIYYFWTQDLLKIKVLYYRYFKF